MNVSSSLPPNCSGWLPNPPRTVQLNYERRNMILKIIGVIALLGIPWSLIDRHILNPKPAVENITRYEDYFIDDHGVVTYYKKTENYG